MLIATFGRKRTGLRWFKLLPLEPPSHSESNNPAWAQTWGFYPAEILTVSGLSCVTTEVCNTANVQTALAPQLWAGSVAGGFPRL